MNGKGRNCSGGKGGSPSYPTIQQNGPVPPSIEFSLRNTLENPVYGLCIRLLACFISSFFYDLVCYFINGVIYHDISRRPLSTWTIRPSFKGLTRLLKVISLLIDPLQL